MVLSQAKDGTNRWVSEGLPASISLELAAVVPVKQIHLAFDTGMHRTLSYSVVKKTSNPGVSPWGDTLELWDDTH